MLTFQSVSVMFVFVAFIRSLSNFSLNFFTYLISAIISSLFEEIKMISFVLYPEVSGCFVVRLFHSPRASHEISFDVFLFHMVYRKLVAEITVNKI